jgi:hypothetical protein
MNELLKRGQLIPDEHLACERVKKKPSFRPRVGWFINGTVKLAQAQAPRDVKSTRRTGQRSIAIAERKRHTSAWPCLFHSTAFSFYMPKIHKYQGFEELHETKRNYSSPPHRPRNAFYF